MIVYDRDPIYGFYFYEAPESTLALFITTFFTSIWALIYAVSLLSLRILGTLKKALNFSLWLLPISTHPVRAIGLSAAANAFLVAIAFPRIAMSIYHFISDFASVR